MEKKREKVKVNGYITRDVWEDFMKKIFEERGRTSGGAISNTMEQAFKLYMKSK